MGTRFALAERMDLYDVKARGLSQPLNSREISHLLRAGHLHPQVPCKPTGKARWLTVGQLFPLLEYGGGTYSLPPNATEKTRTPTRLPLALVSVLVVLAATGVKFGLRRALAYRQTR